MDDDFARQHGLMTEQELSDMDDRFKTREEEGLKNALKHFDRIHDKLFTFNNILIAGYFAVSRLDKTPVATILIPIANLAFLIWIEYRMMEKSRFESGIMSKPFAEIQRYGKSTERTTVYSLFSIFSTAMVTALFLYYLMHTHGRS